MEATSEGKSISLSEDKPMGLGSKIALALCIFILLSFVVAVFVSALNAPPEMMVVVSRGDNYKIVYDRDTMVMYQMTDGKYNAGELSPLYNPDGSLRLYESGGDN